MNQQDSNLPNDPPRSGVRALIAEKPWVLLVGYIVIFVGLSFATLGIALANPPVIIGK